jgi:hypothetical protein
MRKAVDVRVSSLVAEGKKMDASASWSVFYV